MMMKVLACAALVAMTGFAQAESATYNIDPNHTFVTFEGKHFNTSTLRGRFDKKDGSVTIDRAAKTGKAELTIDVTSIDTGVPLLDKHLKSKDFFDADNNGSARFVADKFNFSGDKVSEVSGTLTMLGKTMPVALKATNFNCYENPMLKRETCGGDFETTIMRSHWGMDYGVAKGLPDDIHLLIQIEAIKQQ